MTFTLWGRIQTRLFLVATVGVVWTAIVTPLLPSPPMSGLGGIGMAPMIMTKFMTTIILPYNALALDYQMTFETLGLVAVVGVGWECLYHLLQQFRWDKDWPPLFSLIEMVPEGLAMWVVIHVVGVEHGTWALSSPGMPMFALHFATTWLAMWFFMVGPMRVVHLRWHFEGGRLLSSR